MISFENLEQIEGVKYVYEFGKTKRVNMGHRGRYKTLKLLEEAGWKPGEIASSGSHEIEVDIKKNE